MWFSMLCCSRNDCRKWLSWFQGRCMELWCNSICNDVWISALWRPRYCFTLQKILKGDFVLPQFVSQDGGDILSKVLNTDPETRFTAEDIRKHRWFKQYQPICENQGLIIGKNSIPAEPKILEMIEQFGFKADYAEKCINNNKHN